MDHRVIAEHNRYQRRYYESTWKRTMQPIDSLYVRRQVDTLIEAADLAPGQRVLDVGCGLGRYTLPLLARGFHVTGTDLSPVMLAQLQEMAAGLPLEVIACDVAELDRHCAVRFDRAVGGFVLHHFHDLETALAGVARVLNPGAVAAFLEPVWFNPLYYLQILFTRRMTFRGEKGLSDMRLSKVGAALRRVGFEEVEAIRFGYLPPLLMNSRGGPALETLIARVPLVRKLNAFQIFRARKVSS